jgi:hypothetical protein
MRGQKLTTPSPISDYDVNEELFLMGEYVGPPWADRYECTGTYGCSCFECQECRAECARPSGAIVWPLIMLSAITAFWFGVWVGCELGVGR